MKLCVVQQIPVVWDVWVCCHKKFDAVESASEKATSLAGEVTGELRWRDQPRKAGKRQIDSQDRGPEVSTKLQVFFFFFPSAE